MPSPHKPKPRPARAAPAESSASSEATLPEILLAVVDGLERLEDKVDALQVHVTGMMILLVDVSTKLNPR